MQAVYDLALQTKVIQSTNIPVRTWNMHCNLWFGHNIVRFSPYTLNSIWYVLGIEVRILDKVAHTYNEKQKFRKMPSLTSSISCFGLPEATFKIWAKSVEPKGALKTLEVHMGKLDQMYAEILSFRILLLGGAVSVQYSNPLVLL